MTGKIYDLYRLIDQQMDDSSRLNKEMWESNSNADRDRSGKSSGIDRLTRSIITLIMDSHTGYATMQQSVEEIHRKRNQESDEGRQSQEVFFQAVNDDTKL